MSGQVKMQEQLKSAQNVNLPILTGNVKPCGKCGAIDRYVSGKCRPCAKVSATKYRTKNTDQERARSAKNYAKNADHVRAIRAKYYTKNTEKVRECGDRWRAGNPEKAAAITAKYRKKNSERIKEWAACYYLQNAEQIRENVERWRAENREREAAKKAAWRAENADRVKELAAKWQAGHPENCRAAANRRRVLKLAAGGSFSASEVLAMMKHQKGKCAVCRADITQSYHIDHIYPLSLGGHNGISNIQLLCPHCNLSKNNKHPIDFMQSRGFLL